MQITNFNCKFCSSIILFTFAKMPTYCRLQKQSPKKYVYTSNIQSELTLLIIVEITSLKHDYN